jgi:hypothetical protein
MRFTAAIRAAPIRDCMGLGRVDKPIDVRIAN